MGMLKKFISLMLCLSLILPFVPVTEAADLTDTLPMQNDSSVQESQNQQEIPAVEQVDDEILQFTDVAEAGARVRTYLKARRESFAVGFQMPGSFYDVSGEIMEEAIKHTGVPNEGDYLRYQLDKYECKNQRYNKWGYARGQRDCNSPHSVFIFFNRVLFRLSMLMKEVINGNGKKRCKLSENKNVGNRVSPLPL